MELLQGHARTHLHKNTWEHTHVHTLTQKSHARIDTCVWMRTDSCAYLYTRLQTKHTLGTFTGVQVGAKDAPG